VTSLLAECIIGDWLRDVAQCVDWDCVVVELIFISRALADAVLITEL
jgi:hypothetical protein